jgi:hypothetical protein
MVDSPEPGNSGVWMGGGASIVPEPAPIPDDAVCLADDASHVHQYGPEGCMWSPSIDGPEPERCPTCDTVAGYFGDGIDGWDACDDPWHTASTPEEA